MFSKSLVTLVCVMFATLAPSAFATAPTITSFTPTSGKLTTTVTITGTGFASPATVTFNGVAAGPVTVNSATSITTLVPLTGTTGKIAVTTPGGTVTSTAVFTVTAGVAPSPGFAPPGAPDTLSFSGFNGNEAVDFYFDTTDFGLGVTTLAGVGSVPVTIPATATPGTHWISAVGRKSGDAAQVSFTVRTDWMEQGFRPNHRGRNPFENVLSTDNVDQLEEAWRYSDSQQINSSPADVAGIVYEGFNDGSVRAFNESTGTPTWVYSIGSSVSSSALAVVNSIVYVGAYDSYMYALNATTGALKWRYPAGGVPISAPVVKNGIVYFGANDTNMYALNATTGALIWKYATGDPVESSPAVWNGMVFFGSNDHTVYALDAASGALVWTYATNGVVLGSPVVIDGLVYIGSADDYMYAIEALSGVSIWSYETSGEVVHNAVFENGTLYFGSYDGKVYALNGATGALKWSFTDPSGDYPIDNPCVANGELYIGDYDDTYALNASTGSLDMTLPASSYYGGPIVVNGALFVPDIDSNSLIRYTLNAAANETPSAAPDPATLRHHPLR